LISVPAVLHPIFQRGLILSSDGLYVGLDVGTTKVSAVIGERNERGALEITGAGIAPSTGLRKGVVVNIEATLRAIAQAIEMAEVMSGREVKSCWAGIGGSHVEGINSKGVIRVPDPEKPAREIRQEDISRVLDAAGALLIPLDRQFLEVIPQSYIADYQGGIRNPIDIIAVRLEALVHIITCSKTGAETLVKCINRAGFLVENFILQTLAAGRAVLTQEEKDLGVALVDLGGGTTEMLVYNDGAPFFTSTIPAGGTQVTNDISVLKNISYETAERIKLDAGCCWEPLLEDDDDIIVPGIGGRRVLPIPKSHVMQIIKPRMQETFSMLKERMDKLSLSRPLAAGVVLTGGGAELLGVAELASNVFNMPVRVGESLQVEGLAAEYRSPVYAAALGLVLEGAVREGRGKAEGEGTAEGHSREKNFTKKMLDWFRKEFF
jgi:cell division protein FtsA